MVYLALMLSSCRIFIELAQKDLVTGRIWFECLWVCLFWMLYLGEKMLEWMVDKCLLPQLKLVLLP